MEGKQAEHARGTQTTDTRAPRGTYALLVRLDRDTVLQVGRLGQRAFPASWYLYVGSALGPGGLRARLARHRRADKRFHWHIDYLLSHGALVANWQIASPIRLECAWANALHRLADASLPVPGFGASDCRCTAHLVRLPRRPSDAEVRRALLSVSPPSAFLHCVCYGDCTGR